MKREQIIQILHEAAAIRLTDAREADADAMYERRAGGGRISAEHERDARFARWSAGCSLAAINHLNGVSPE